MNTNYKKMLAAEINENIETRSNKEQEFKKLFSKKLAQYLTDHNISTKTLAEHTGYTIQHCSNLKKGEDATKAPSLFCLYRLSTALDLSPQYLWNFDKTFNSPSENEVLEAKKESLINKINNINNEKLLNKLLNDVDFLLDLQSNENDQDFNY